MLKHFRSLVSVLLLKLFYWIRKRDLCTKCLFSNRELCVDWIIMLCILCFYRWLQSYLYIGIRIWTILTDCCNERVYRQCSFFHQGFLDDIQGAGTFGTTAHVLLLPVRCVQATWYRIRRTFACYWLDRFFEIDKLSCSIW